MPTAAWDPFRELAAVQDRLNRLFGELYGRRGEEDVWTGGDWSPPVDIFETDTQDLVLQVDLPGVSREAIDVRVEDTTLTIRAERKRRADIRDEQYHRRERSFGSFGRSFTLPATVDSGRIRAEYRDGVLTVILPKREEARPKQIQVQVG
jgi:HSP20 family protein